MEIKRCSMCGREYPATSDYFYRNSGGGLRSNCKECSRKGQRAINTKKNEDKMINKMADISPRELMKGLSRRGYSGKLTYVQEIDIEKL